MGTINTAVQLSTVRAKIDAQQQLIARFEQELQEIILGRNDLTFQDMLDGYDYDNSSGRLVNAPLYYTDAAGGYTDATGNPVTYPVQQTDAQGNPMFIQVNDGGTLSHREGIREILDDHPGLFNAMEDGLTQFKTSAEGLGTKVDQTAIRQMLYQARAVLGELRVEEQQWNTEVNEEKARRKELGDFAKG